MITIGQYSFEGPFLSTNSLQDRSGIYAIIDNQNNDNTIIDIGESSEVKSRIENHDRRFEWNRKAQGRIVFAVLYTLGYDQSQRKTIEQALRAKFNPACGDR